MYKGARNDVGMTLDDAAFKLHIGIRTLYNYENFVRITPPGTVCDMSRLYDKPSLRRKYCSDVCPIGKIDRHPVEERDLATAVLGLIKKHNDVKLIRERLIDIASDGIISAEEWPEFNLIMGEIRQLEQKIDTLRLFADSVRKKKEKAPAVRPRFTSCLNSC